jgi:two-component sensor histidine kinase
VPRLVATLVGIILVVSSIFGGLLCVIEVDRQIASLQRKATAAADHLQRSLALPTWNLGFREIEAQLDVAMLDREAYGLQLSLDGVQHPPIYRSRDANWNVAATEPLSDSGLLVATRDIDHNGTRVASIVVWYTDRFVRKDVARQVMFLAALIMTEAFSLALALIVALRSSVFLPLGTIERWADGVSRGERGTEPETRGDRGEIGGLHSSISRMVGLLDERYEEIAARERDLRSALALQEALAQELFHRTRNNIQVISGLISLREAKLGKAPGVEELRAIALSVDVIALAQEELYECGDFSCLDLGSYLRALAETIGGKRENEPTNLELSIETEALPVVIDIAIPIGLIVADLLARARGIAGSEGGPTRIALSLKRKPEGRAVINVSDDGEGPRPDFESDRAALLDIETVKALVKQVRGVLDYDSARRFSCTIEFPESIPGLSPRI